MRRKFKIQLGIETKEYFQKWGHVYYHDCQRSIELSKNSVVS